MSIVDNFKDKVQSLRNQDLPEEAERQEEIYQGLEALILTLHEVSEADTEELKKLKSGENQRSFVQHVDQIKTEFEREFKEELNIVKNDIQEMNQMSRQVSNGNRQNNQAMTAWKDTNKHIASRLVENLEEEAEKLEEILNHEENDAVNNPDSLLGAIYNDIEGEEKALKIELEQDWSRAYR
jgi:hypothetical protein